MTSTGMNANCPVCNSRLLAPMLAANTRVVPLNCPRCGPFIIMDDALSMLKPSIDKKSLRWAITSYAIRRLHAGTVTQAWLQSVWAQQTLPRPQEQADIFVQFLGAGDVVAGDWIPCKPQQLSAVLGTADTDQDTTGFRYVIDGLKAKRLIQQQTPLPAQDGSMSYRLAFDGWERYDELTRHSVDSRTAFMAMGYSDEHVAQAFGVFVDAVAQTGFTLRRLDKKPKAGLIDLRMRVEIRAAKFLVADLTDENRGAYWEAGFAEGLGKKVYYTCEASKFKKAKTHFDTEHLLTVKWDPENMPPAVDELKSAIRNDFPTDAMQSDDQERMPAQNFE